MKSDKDIKQNTLHEQFKKALTDKNQEQVKDNIDAKGQNECAPLHSAVAARNAETVELLLKNGADINAKDKFGWTPLHLAVGHPKIVEFLIDKGAKIDAKDKFGWTPLHLAASRGNLDIVTLLIDKGADVNIPDNLGQTPLHLAASRGHPKIVEFLIDKRAKINVQDNARSTPLHVAVAAENLDIVKLLIAGKADINAIDYAGSTPLKLSDRLLKKEIRDFLTNFQKQQEQLIEKIQDNKIDETEHLIINIGNIGNIGNIEANNTQNNNGQPPLDVAQNGSANIVTLLQDQDTIDGDTNKDPDTIDKDKKIDEVKPLIGNIDNIEANNTQSNNGQPPLDVDPHQVTNKDNTEQTLVNQKADISTKDKDGKTAFQLGTILSKLWTLISSVLSYLGIITKDKTTSSQQQQGERNQINNPHVTPEGKNTTKNEKQM